jgi:hypothetical protein
VGLALESPGVSRTAAETAVGTPDCDPCTAAGTVARIGCRTAVDSGVGTAVDSGVGTAVERWEAGRVANAGTAHRSHLLRCHHRRHHCQHHCHAQKQMLKDMTLDQLEQAQMQRQTRGLTSARKLPACRALESRLALWGSPCQLVWDRCDPQWAP